MKKMMKRIAAVLIATSLVVPVCDMSSENHNIVKADTVAQAEEASQDDGSAGLTQIDKLQATSVDGKIKVCIWKDTAERYYYSAYRNGEVTLKCAPLGLITEATDLSKGLKLDEASIQMQKGKEEYDWVQGSSSHVSKEYQEMSFCLTRDTSKIKMIFRLFNDGIGYRYEVDGDVNKTDETTVITSEESSFELPETGNIWTMPVSATYEAGSYTSRKMTSIKNMNDKVAPPILGKMPNKSSECWVLLAEANVYNEEKPYCACNFITKSGSAAFKVNFGLRLKQEEDDTLDGKTYSAQYEDVKKVTMQDVFHTPWRLAIMTDTLEDLTNSSLVSDLNPAAEGDFSWVEPGTSSWSWWSTTSDAIDYNTMRDYIDYAQETGQKYCLVDFGWENWSDYENKIKELVQYADKKGVGLLLWYGVNKFDQPHKFDLDNPETIEQEFAWCEKLGVKGVKVDYLNSDSQFAMKVMYDLASIAAKHKLVLNYHGCTDPNGENRTFPNILSSEAVMGSEYFKWGAGSPVKTLLTLPYARNVIGSMEFTPVCMSVKNVSATNGFMLAMPIVYESAIQTLAHSAYVYPGYGGLSLLVDIPSTWDESRLLDGYPGDSVIRARRSGDTWYVGAMTNKENTYDISLDFLDKDTTYYAYIYTDNEDGSNIEMKKQAVTSTSKLSLALKKAGGCGIKISKSDTLKTTCYDNYNYFEAENASLGEGTAISETSYVSGKKYVSKIGRSVDKHLTFADIEAPEAGMYDLKLYLVSSSKRTIYIKVNNYEPVVVKSVLGVSGDSNAVGCTSTQVYLDKGKNKIHFYNLAATAPSVDRIAVSKNAVSKVDTPPAIDTDTALNEALNTEKSDNNDGDNNNNPSDKDDTSNNNTTPNNNPVNVNTQNNNTNTQTVPNTKTDNSVVSKPSKVKGVVVKSKKKKQILVKYKKIKNASNYQICYSTNKKFKKAKKILTKASKKTIKKLKSKKTYYIRVRAIKKNGAKKLYGTWSKTVKVKVK